MKKSIKLLIAMFLVSVISVAVNNHERVAEMQPPTITTPTNVAEMQPPTTPTTYVAEMQPPTSKPTTTTV